MTDSGSDNENRGRFMRQVQIYSAAAAATGALGSVQMAFSFPGWNFSFLVTLVFTISAFYAWTKSRK